MFLPLDLLSEWRGSLKNGSRLRKKSTRLKLPRLMLLSMFRRIPRMKRHALRHLRQRSPAAGWVIGRCRHLLLGAGVAYVADTGRRDKRSARGKPFRRITEKLDVLLKVFLHLTALIHPEQSLRPSHISLQNRMPELLLEHPKRVSVLRFHLKVVELRGCGTGGTA